jgi:glycosyltransferase involved in cell wall biosynthesis
MKVAYDHQIFGLQQHGGISRYFAELVGNLLVEPDIEPTVIAPVYINEYLRRDAIGNRVRGRYLPFNFRGRGRVVRATNDALAPLAWLGRSYDVIHETYYSSVSKGHGRVRVLTIYDMIHELYPDELLDSAQVRQAKRCAVQRADHVICISETTRRDATEILGIESNRCSVIHLGCSLEGRPPDPRVSGSMEPCVLYVGLRDGYKNFKVLLEAFASSKKLRTGLKLVAFGGPRFSIEEETAIHRLGLDGRVQRASGDDSVLRAYYGAAVAFVYPSRYEGFGIPPLEAMAAGCPVVCSTAPSIREVVGEAAAYFEPDDSGQLRVLLERICDDEQYRDELRAKGARRIRLYSWATCAAETGSLYRRLAAAAD